MISENEKDFVIVNELVCRAECVCSGGKFSRTLFS